MKRLCILFPGIGYTPDKPLLYYTGKYYKKKDYEIISIKYGELPKKGIGDTQKMKKTFELAMDSVRLQLSDLKWSDYDDIIFVGKSIGTIVSAAYAKEAGIPTEKTGFIYMTPLAETFKFASPSSGIAFHGTSDPWVETHIIEDCCKEKDIPLYIYPDANHSLETGDILQDIDTVSDVMNKISNWK